MYADDVVVSISSIAAEYLNGLC